MKNIWFAFLLAVTGSAHASNLYECQSAKGIIVIDESSQFELTITNSRHDIAKTFSFNRTFSSLYKQGKEGVEDDPETGERNSRIVIKKDNLNPSILRSGKAKDSFGAKFENSKNKIKISTSTGSGISYSHVKFDLNKKKLILKISIKEDSGAGPIFGPLLGRGTHYKAKDKLKCKRTKINN